MDLPTFCFEIDSNCSQDHCDAGRGASQTLYYSKQLSAFTSAHPASFPPQIRRAGRSGSNVSSHLSPEVGKCQPRAEHGRIRLADRDLHYGPRKEACANGCTRGNKFGANHGRRGPQPGPPARAWRRPFQFPLRPAPGRYASLHTPRRHLLCSSQVVWDTRTDDTTPT